MANADISTSQQRGVDLVHFNTEANLDESAIERIRERLYALVDGAARKVVLDLGNVAFLSSQALGCFVTLRLKAARTGSTVALAGVRPMLVELIQVTQLDKLYQLYATPGEAVAALAG